MDYIKTMKIVFFISKNIEKVSKKLYNKNIEIRYEWC